MKNSNLRGSKNKIHCGGHMAPPPGSLCFKNTLGWIGLSYGVIWHTFLLLSTLHLFGINCFYTSVKFSDFCQNISKTSFLCSYSIYRSRNGPSYISKTEDMNMYIKQCCIHASVKIKTNSYAWASVTAQVTNLPLVQNTNEFIYYFTYYFKECEEMSPRITCF